MSGVEARSHLTVRQLLVALASIVVVAGLVLVDSSFVR